MDRGSILDVSKLRFQGDFTTQVTDILQQVRLTREEVVDLGHLYEDLQHTLQKQWKDCKVVPFGSIVTGLGIKTSDADCYVDLKNRFNNKNFFRKTVMAARNVLAQSPLFAKPFAIVGAKVPIVQFTYVPSQTHCDVNFSSRAGVRNSQLIGFLHQIDDRALHLAILIKYWSKVHGLTGTNKLSNYSLAILTIFYLQNVGVLPSVQYIQKNADEPDIVDEWDTSFTCSVTNIPQSQNNTPLHHLLGGFFKFYSEFDFKDNIISPYLGYPIKRSDFADLNSMPNDFELYKKNITSKLSLPLRVDTNICIQDPFEHNRNCTVGLTLKLEQALKAFITLGAAIYEDCSEDYSKFLKELLTQVPRQYPVYPAVDAPTSTQKVHINQVNRPNKIVKRKKQKVIPLAYRYFRMKKPVFDIRVTKTPFGNTGF